MLVKYLFLNGFSKFTILQKDEIEKDANFYFAN